MAIDMTGKAALVTGAASGLGRATARKLAEAGASLCLVDVNPQGLAETADLLNLSPRTVGTHLYNIKQKLGASNAAEIALAAIRAGLIEP